MASLVGATRLPRKIIIIESIQTSMLPDTLKTALQQHGISDFSETALREALEQHVPTYTLIRLADWPARRWKCRYRLMMGDAMYDAQTVSEAYALALLATL